jgi:drug/metabolite transporter (DMT)-like permease
MWGRMFFGALFILIFLVFTHQAVFLNKLNSEQISWTIFTGIILLAYVFTWYSGLKFIKVSEAAIILMLGSPITAMLAAIFSKPAALREYLASGLIILGILGILGADKFIKRAKRAYVRS